MMHAENCNSVSLTWNLTENIIKYDRYVNCNVMLIFDINMITLMFYKKEKLSPLYLCKNYVE
jgi:predicted RNA-binding protein with PIN domain